MKAALALAASLVLPATAAAIDIGPAVGTTAPALHAVDKTGAPAALPAIVGKNGVVLVFFRSAKWCPFCQKQLIELRDVQAPLAQRGYTLAAISYDAPDTLAGFAEERDIKYTLLSDAGSVTIDAFQLRDPQYPRGNMAYGVPKPSIFVLSPDGVVKAKLAEEGYKTRPDNAAILAAVDGAGG